MSRRAHDPTRIASRGRAATWALVLATLVLSGGAFVYGVHSFHAGTVPGRWIAPGPTDASPDPADDDPAQRAQAEDRLASLPYLAGYRTATSEGGKTDRTAEAYDGFNLVVSAHAPEALLLDLDGNVMHRWQCTFERAWGDDLPFDVKDRVKGYFRRAWLYPNGDLLAIFSYVGIVKLDKDSNILWKRAGRQHHAVDVDADGNIYTLTSHLGERLQLERIDMPLNQTSDSIEILSPTGERVRALSLTRCFLDSDFAGVLECFDNVWDPLHVNSIRILDDRLADRHPAFAEGNLLISLRNTSTIAVVDPKEQRVVWALRGSFLQQHEAILTERDTILCFDNRGRIPSPGPDGSRTNAGRSRVLEIDPFSRRIVWSYGGGDGEDFYSEICGVVQPLPNGSVLVTNSCDGQAFEVTRDKRRVWSMETPFRADDKIATLFQVTRIPTDRIDFRTSDGGPSAGGRRDG